MRDQVKRAERPTLPVDAQDAIAEDATAADLAEAMRACWAQEPRQRPTFAAISAKLLGKAQLLRWQDGNRGAAPQ